MFNALNSLISRLDSDPKAHGASQTVGETTSSYGFQVLRNTNPDLPLEPWFDFIIGINGHYIEQPEPSLFATEIRNCAGGFCSLDLWSAKGQRTYALTIPVPSSPQSLGLSLQFSPLNATHNIWHVLSIPSSLSPAHVAGLLPHSDYILGSPSGTLRGESALSEIIEDHLNRSLVLWVYNSEFDVVREVELVPRRGWGGEGALGAVLGYGALHRLPVGLGEEVQAPGENLFDAEKSTDYPMHSGENAQFAQARPTQILSPPPMMNANIAPPPMVSPSAPPAVGLTPQVAGRSKKARSGVKSPNRAFEDMFEEGAKKSAEQDFVPTRKNPVAPPPKLGTASHETIERQQGKTDDEDIGEPGDAEVT